METSKILIGYLIYLPITILLTYFVSRTLFKNGQLFMLDIFKEQEGIANATNRLLEVGFYLLNLGWALIILKIETSHFNNTYQNLIEVLSSKIGGFSIYLGIMLFLNIFLFFRGRKKAEHSYNPLQTANLMKTASLSHKIKLQKTNKEKVTEFYDKATKDYEFWSKDYNMHFGYFIFDKTHPFRRDSMLNEMNAQVLKQLHLKDKTNLITDFGCGMGGSIRYALQKDPKLSAIDVALSLYQVKMGAKLLKKLNGMILKRNYNNTRIKSTSTDGVIAIESLCHGGHQRKNLEEAYRILKPNSRLVIADVFLKKEPSELCIASTFCNQKLCQGWSLERLGSIDSIKHDLSSIGFHNMKIQDISHRVAPSVLHVPLAIIGFLFKKLQKREAIKPQGQKNLVGSLFALLSGLHIRSFGYHLITAEK